MKPYLSVIIPAYNEAKRLPLTLVDIDKHLSAADFSYEILVVNDGSKDATAEIARRFSHIVKYVRIIDNHDNHGKGWVVRQGMLEAHGTIRIFTDADNSTSIDQFEKMIPYFKDGFSVVMGSRDIPGSELIPPQPWYKRIAGNIGNIIIQALLLPGFWDTQCGFKAFTEEAAVAVFSRSKIDRWGFDVEALSLAKHLGFRIKEIPVVWVNSPFSHVKASTYIKVFFEVFKVRWWLWRGYYGTLNADK